MNVAATCTGHKVWLVYVDVAKVQWLDRNFEKYKIVRNLYLPYCGVSIDAMVVDGQQQTL